MTNVSARCGGDSAGRPLVAGTLRGYRSWLPLRSDDLPAGALPLASVLIPLVIWTPTLHARCFAAEFAGGTRVFEQPAAHRAPAGGCRCGIYGWYRARDRRMVQAPVFGVIAASGMIVMGTHGFRAQQASIVAVVTHHRSVTKACERAGIAVYRRRRHLVRDYPTEDLTALLDDHVQ
jgi:hypothetical protein